MTSYDPSMYQMMSHVEHILKRPDTYISSVDQNPREERLFDTDTGKFVTRVCTVPLGLERLFLEILSNAGDNVHRSRLAGVDPGTIVVTMDRETISITNYGIPIPVEVHPTQGIPVPEMIFGHLLTSGNYTGDRTGAGLNGLGAKLTNVYSSMFSIDIMDASRGLRYQQEWKGNMSVRSDPVVTQLVEGDLPNGLIGMVNVKYKVDLFRFGYGAPPGAQEGPPGALGEYPDDAFKLFIRHAIDTSVTCKIPVIFNGTTFDMRNFGNFIDLLYPEKNKFYHYEWPPGTKVTIAKNGMQTAESLAIPLVEMCIIDTPDEGTSISFVNGLLTQDGGTHVDSAYKAVGSTILETLNKEKKLLNIGDVKNHLTIVILCRVLNPTYNSQSKTKLTHPATIKITIPDKLLKVISKWEFVKRLYFALEAKQFKQLQKTDGKRRKHVDIEKLDDANNAGDPVFGQQCALYIVEGRSAAEFVSTMISVLGGRDYMGILPIQGKILNVRNSSALQMAKNKEIVTLKEALGLKEGVDYSNVENLLQLRYGKIVIGADSDSDGKHIIGLLLNLFDCNYNSLIKRGYICFLRTPIISISKGIMELKFYTKGQYEQWRKTAQTKGWTHKYYKGLGRFSKEEIKKEMLSPKVTDFEYDPDAKERLDLVFNSKRADERKKWIASWTEERQELDCGPTEAVSAFLDNEMIEHSIENIRRTIPRLDGLKDVHRKILYVMMTKYASRKDPIKVAQLAGGVAEKSSYHHGEVCLGEAIVYMAQDFAGANNLPLLVPEGAFGTRKRGRKYHSETRYIYTRLSWCVKFLFRKEDVPLYKYIVDEGEEYEPEVMFPILPMHLINGSLGIGTGHSTFIPNYNPVHLYEWFRRRILGLELPKLCPWYRGYNGEIVVTYREPKEQSEKEKEESTEISKTSLVAAGKEIKKRRTMYSFKTTGSFEVNNGMVIVHELPLFVWTKNYDVWLNSLITEKKINRSRNLSTDETVYFEITGFDSPDLKSLQLVENYSLMNMTILDENNMPVTYKSLEDLLEHFYNWRLGIYVKRKEAQMKNLLEEIMDLERHIKFLLDIISGKLLIVNWKTHKTRPKREIVRDMEALGHTVDLLKSGIGNLTMDDVDDLQMKIEKKKNEYNIIDKKSPGDIWLGDLADFIKEYMIHYPSG